MAFKLVKIDLDMDNLEARYELTHEEEKIKVVFQRKKIRQALDWLGFSSHRIGYIIRLINKQFPIERNKYIVTSNERFSDEYLISYLEFNGFKIMKREERINVIEAVEILQSRGYVVRACNEGLPYSMPVINKN